MLRPAHGLAPAQPAEGLGSDRLLEARPPVAGRLPGGRRAGVRHDARPAPAPRSTAAASRPTRSRSARSPAPTRCSRTRRRFPPAIPRATLARTSLTRPRRDAGPPGDGRRPARPARHLADEGAPGPDRQQGGHGGAARARDPARPAQRHARGRAPSGMAIKIEDGDGYDRGTWAASVEALRQAGVLDGGALRELARYHRPSTLDPHGRVGRRGDPRLRARAGRRARSADPIRPAGRTGRRIEQRDDGPRRRSVSHARPGARRVARRGQARLPAPRQGQPPGRGRRPTRCPGSWRSRPRTSSWPADRRRRPGGRGVADGATPAVAARTPSAPMPPGAPTAAAPRRVRPGAGGSRHGARSRRAGRPGRRAGRRTAAGAAGRRRRGRAQRPAPGPRVPPGPRAAPAAATARTRRRRAARRRSARRRTTAPTASPFEPDWGGASWYGTTSGTYWTINPKEYADPRKHGPEYQARARRAIEGGRGRGSRRRHTRRRSDSTPTAARTSHGPGRPGPRNQLVVGRLGTDGHGGAPPPTPRERPASADRIRRPPGPHDRPRTDAADPHRQASPPSDDTAPDPARAAIDLGRALTDPRSGGLRRARPHGQAWVGCRSPWASGWLVGELTGCGRFAATCDPAVAPLDPRGPGDRARRAAPGARARGDRRGRRPGPAGCRDRGQPDHLGDRRRGRRGIASSGTRRAAAGGVAERPRDRGRSPRSAPAARRARPVS